MREGNSPDRNNFVWWLGFKKGKVSFPRENEY